MTTEIVRTPAKRKPKNELKEADRIIKPWQETCLPHTSIPRLIYLDGMLQPADIVVLGAIVLFMMKGDGKCRPSMKTLENIARLTRRNLFTRIQRLQSAGWLVAKRRYARSNIYHTAVPIIRTVDDFIKRFRVDDFPVIPGDLLLKESYQIKNELKKFELFFKHLAELRKQWRGEKNGLAQRALEKANEELKGCT